jgi:hypothetical protein
VALAAALICASAACGSGEPEARPAFSTAWHEVASWKGHGNAQLDMFPIEHYDWRIRWETSNAPGPGRGRLHVEAHSADSGRLLADPIDVRGNGRGTANVNVDPHRYFLVVQSNDVDWSLTVEEPGAGP